MYACTNKQSAIALYSQCFLLNPALFRSEDITKYILFKVFPLISFSLFPPSFSLCHFVSALLLFVPLFPRSALQFQHFNISSNISRAESSIAELFSTTGNLGEESLTHTHTLILINTHVRTRCGFMALGVGFWQ